MFCLSFSSLRPSKSSKSFWNSTFQNHGRNNGCFCFSSAQKTYTQMYQVCCHVLSVCLSSLAQNAGKESRFLPPKTIKTWNVLWNHLLLKKSKSWPHVLFLFCSKHICSNSLPDRSMFCLSLCSVERTAYTRFSQKLEILNIFSGIDFVQNDLTYQSMFCFSLFWEYIFQMHFRNHDVLSVSLLA